MDDAASARAVTALLASLVVAGCGGASGTQPVAHDTKCIPAWPVASPGTVAPGGTIVLRDRGLPCHPFSGPQMYSLMLAPPQKPGGLPDYDNEQKLMSFKVGVRGAFRVAVRLPSTVLPGSAQLILHGPELDRRLSCQDSGSGSCKPFSAGVIIKRAG